MYGSLLKKVNEKILRCSNSRQLSNLIYERYIIKRLSDEQTNIRTEVSSD